MCDFLQVLNLFISGLQELSEIHAGFHSQLRKACTPQSTFRLSEVFINWREKFLIYGDYCANLTAAQNLIQELCIKDNTINQEVIVSYLKFMMIIHVSVTRVLTVWTCPLFFRDASKTPIMENLNLGIFCQFPCKEYSSIICFLTNS